MATGHSWQRCQFWPQFGDLGQTDFSKQLFLLAEATKTQPGSEKLGDRVSTSLGTGSQSLFTHGLVTVRAPGRAVGAVVGTWALQREMSPLWG